MGRKKRPVTTRTKPSSPLILTVADDGRRDGTERDCDLENEVRLSIESEGYGAVKVECQKALNAIRRGNHMKAIRLMKVLCGKYENPAYLALVHRVQGTVCVKAATIIDDPKVKQRHLKIAIKSAKKAAMLSPVSVEFAYFYANLIYETASGGKDFEDSVRECERALAIKNPIDPGKESLQDESQLTADARIANVQNELRALLQKASMRTLGHGEDKFRIIGIRRVSGDPMDVRVVQGRRPNDIKKASKTYEERKKEIEVKVAAARLLQHKQELALTQPVDNASKANVLSHRAMISIIGFLKPIDEQASKSDAETLAALYQRRKMELEAEERKLQETLEYQSREDSCVTSIRVDLNSVTGVGEYNCFLSVIIQSLWHLKRFREEFLNASTTAHLHVGVPCVTCTLYDIFSALESDRRVQADDLTSLWHALSNLYPDSNFYHEEQMHDPTEEGLELIFDCLHDSFTTSTDIEVEESNVLVSGECQNKACIAHSVFGMNIFELMNCSNCELETTSFKYTSYFHRINANALRTMKVVRPESSFDELLNLVERNDQSACDPDDDGGGCGNLNYSVHILYALPHVFTIVLAWQNIFESVEDIKATLAALSTEIDLSVLYRGLETKKTRLFSVVCYNGQHYNCFAYSHVNQRWVMYDDQTVKVIGRWEDVVLMCEKGHLQPHVLFYEE